MTKWSRMTDDEKVLRWKPLFYKVARKMKREGFDRLRDVEDLVQWAMIGFFKSKMPEHVPREFVRNWISAGARSELDFTAKKRKMEFLCPSGEGRRDSIYEISEKRVFKDFVEASHREVDPDEVMSLECLSDREKQILKLYFVGGKLMSEVGEEVGMSKGSIHRIIHLCLDKIREHYEKS